MRKKLQVTLKKIGGLKNVGKGEWVDFLEVEPEEKEIIQQKGNLYTLVSLRGRWSLKGKGLLKAFLNDLSVYYYQNPENSVIKNLEQAVKYAHRRLVHQLNSEENADTLFNIIVFILWGNVLYIAQAGKAKALLLRQDEGEFIGSDLESNLKEELFSNTIHIASGLIRKDDLLILGLPDFWKAIDLKRVKIWFKNHSFEEAVKKINAFLVEKNTPVAQAIMFRFTIGIFPSEEEVIKIMIPPTEEKSRWLKKGQEIIEAVRNRISLFAKKKPLTIEVEREKNLKERFQREIEINKDQTVISSPVPQGPVVEDTESVEPRATPLIEETPSQIELKPQEVTKAKEIKDRIGDYFKKVVVKARKQLTLIKEQIEQARKRSKARGEKESPELYLRTGWFSRFFAKKGWLIVILLAGLLVGSVLLTNRLKQQTTENTQNKNLYEQTFSGLEEAKRVSFSDAQRLEIFKKGEELFSKLQNEKYSTTELDLLKAKLQELKEVIFKVVRVKEPKLVADLSLKKEGTEGRDIVKISDTLYILDYSYKTLFLVNVKTGAVEVKQVGDEGLTHLLRSGDNLYGFSLQGLKRYSSDTGEFATVIESSDKWQEIVDLGEYYGNIYLLDPKAKQIWKYLTGGENFSNINPYLSQIPDAEFTNAVSLGIDGSIYVLITDGQVWKYTFQQRKEFKLNGLDTPFVNPRQMQTHEDFQNIYILDTGNKRVVVFDKNGKYQKQYINETWDNLKAFVIDKTEKILYLLNGSQIYEIPLD